MEIGWRFGTGNADGDLVEEAESAGMTFRKGVYGSGIGSEACHASHAPVSKIARPVSFPVLAVRISISARARLSSHRSREAVRNCH